MKKAFKYKKGKILLEAYQQCYSMTGTRRGWMLRGKHFCIEIHPDSYNSKKWNYSLNIETQPVSSFDEDNYSRTFDTVELALVGAVDRLMIFTNEFISEIDQCKKLWEVKP